MTPKEFLWCGEGDLNPHSLGGTEPCSPRCLLFSDLRASTARHYPLFAPTFRGSSATLNRLEIASPVWSSEAPKPIPCWLPCLPRSTEFPEPAIGNSACARMIFTPANPI